MMASVNDLRSLTQPETSQGEMSFIDGCIEFLERDTRGFQILTYGITGLGLLAALYRIRPFAKFGSPSDVPARFVKVKEPLQGKVVRIDRRHGALLMVDHTPLVNIPRPGTPELLPVKLAGVDVTDLGIRWLRFVVCGKKIVFVPFSKSDEYLDCEVTLQESNESTISIGEELVRLGFGTVGKLESEQTVDQQISAYKCALEAAQKVAKIERNGHWHFAIKPSYLWKFRLYIHSKLTQLLPPRIANQLSF